MVWMYLRRFSFQYRWTVVDSRPLASLHLMLVAFSARQLARISKTVSRDDELNKKLTQK